MPARRHADDRHGDEVRSRAVEACDPTTAEHCASPCGLSTTAVTAPCCEDDEKWEELHERTGIGGVADRSDAVDPRSRDGPGSSASSICTTAHMAKRPPFLLDVATDLCA